MTNKTAPPPPLESSGDKGDPPSLLLADDDGGVSRALRRLFVTAGYEVTVADDGAKAAEALMQRSFDAVVSDIHMPNMTGVELLSIVRAYDLDVPVILLTGDPSLHTAVEALKLGAMEYLTKPWKNEQLLDAVARACKLHALAKLKREAMKAMGKGEAAGDLAGLTIAFEHVLQTLFVVVQPIVEPRTRTLFGYECLLRSLDRALPAPLDVVHAADKLQREHELGRAMRRAIAELISTRPPPRDALVFFNLHPKDLLDPELFARESPLAPYASRLVVEITERAALTEIADARRRIGDLRMRGYRIALDDLGGGYAGLSSLAILEPDFVKLDTTLVRDLRSSAVRQKLVASMTSTCRELHMRVIAEGVENREDSRALDEIGCELMQGYLFAKPGLPYPSVTWGNE